MTSASEKLMRLVAAEDRFDYSAAELRETQVAALDERFQERKDRIKLLGHRAREAGTAEIRRREDMVPLLFPHTVYKSYPESFLIEERWDRLGKWLGTVSPYPISPIEPSVITASNTTNGTPSVEAPNAWIESRIPERTRKSPTIARVPVSRTSETFQTFSIPRFSWIMIEWMNAVAHSHGISAAFSTGSQAQ